jgi:exosortase
LKSSAPWLVFLAAIWAQLFYTASYGWLYGNYYSYGWYVPPLAALFFGRLFLRWDSVSQPIPLHPGTFVALLAFGCIAAGVRALQIVDPNWTMPLWIHTFTVVAITIFIVYRAAGARALMRMIPVILFALTAIQLPMLIERTMVNSLTKGVVGTSVFILNLFGQQASAMGSQLDLKGQVVHVTEGCSGVKSAQSFLMASLFFGEWMELRLKQRLLMVLYGFATAWVLNIARACALAIIRADKGASAFTAAHDPLGIVAFVIGSLLLLLISSYLAKQSVKRLKVRKLVKSAAV